MTSFIQGNFFYTNSLPQPDKTKQIQICCDPSNHTEYYYQIFSRPRKFLHKHEPMRLSPSMSTPRDRAQQLQWQEQEAQEKGISSRSTNFAQKKRHLTTRFTNYKVQTSIELYCHKILGRQGGFGFHIFGSCSEVTPS